MSVLALSLAGLVWATGRSVMAWTTTRSVTGLASAPDGRYFAASNGGLIERGSDGIWKKLTVADGLPSNEVLALEWRSDRLVARFPAGTFRSTKAGWARLTDGAEVKGPPMRLDTPTQKISVAPFAGLQVEMGATRKRFAPHVPPGIFPLTSVAGDAAYIVIGTTGHGLWELVGGAWRHVDFDEPSGNSIVSMSSHDGTLYVSTLDEGLNRIHDGRWSLEEGLSSTATRESVEYGQELWVRNADGSVDREQHGAWSKDVLKSQLPRREARFLATDGKRLFVAEWGGWSQLADGTWAHHLKRPELAGVATTCLLPEGDHVWIGTQGKGLARASLTASEVVWVDERKGMPDDWVTCLARFGDDVFAGTFVGGLVRISNGRASTVDSTKGSNVTCLVVHGSSLWFGTRTGLFVYKEGKATPVKGLLPEEKPEVQSLCFVGEKLFVGTRTGLYETTP